MIPISAVLFDMNEVLCNYDKAARVASLARFSGKAASFIEAAIWGAGYEDLADTGAMDADEYLRGFGERIGYRLAKGFIATNSPGGGNQRCCRECSCRKRCEKKVPLGPTATHAEGPPNRRRDRPRRLEIAAAQGLAPAWAKRGADLRVPAPGQLKKVAMMGALDGLPRKVVVTTSRTKRSADFIALLMTLDQLYGPKPSLFFFME